MWIAKPLSALSVAERRSWIESQKPERPLSQTLAWAEAAMAVLANAGGEVYVIFNPEEGVGGIVHSAGSPLDFECTNGPMLDWESDQAPRQIATFAMAVSKAAKSLRSLRLHPRWLEVSEIETDAILNDLPIPAQSLSRASTLVIDLKDSLNHQRAGFSPRLVKTLQKSQEAGVQACQLELSGEQIGKFALAMQTFGRERGFYVPDERWFHALTRGVPDLPRESLEFFLIEAHLGTQALTQLLCCLNRDTAYYLFGFDQRNEDVPASVSTAAVAHEMAMQLAFARGARTYDLNGYIDPTDESQAGHPYAGVSRFKSQFGGSVVHYASPEFTIEN